MAPHPRPRGRAAGLQGDAVNALDYLARAHLLAGELTTAALMLEATVQEATGGPGAS